MNKRFIFETAVGIIAVAAVLFFGQKGMAALALFALLPLFSKKKFDEREYYLFYKTGNLTVGILIPLLVLINYFSDVTINNIAVGANWLSLSISLFMIAHGISGLVIFNKD